MDFLGLKLIDFLPPALVVSATAYLIRFFGKIIADQKPFADDRSWEVELSGLIFFINLIVLPGIIGAVLGHYLGNFGTGHWIRFILISFCGAWLLLSNIVLGRTIYGLKFSKILAQSDFVRWYQKYLKKIFKITRWTPLWLFSIFFIYIITIEYVAGNVVWLMIIVAETFLNFILLALNYSLRRTHLPCVDVYLIGHEKPLRNLTLLKINEDNVRLRGKGKIIVLNKNQMLKIEIKANKDKKQSM